MPSDHLSVLYEQALCFVFPSFYEGFGLPPLEAMAHGTPVIASNRASLPDVCGDAALFVDPSSDWRTLRRRCIAIVLSEPETRARLRERGFENVKRFSWRTIFADGDMADL